MKPFTKWAGGKTQLLPHLLAHRVSGLGRYYEPFVGGGALFFGLGHLANGATLGDSNADLMICYEQIRDNLANVLGAMRVLARAYNARECDVTRASMYYAQRELFGLLLPHEMRAALFIFLNKTGFNGLFRVNRDGKFNVPWGKRKEFFVDAENISACSRALQGVTLVTGDFAETTRDAKAGDFVYFDPPYVPASASANFTAYQKEPFGPREQERLRNVAFDLKNRGVSILLSNSDTPLVHELYRGFEIKRVEARRNINRDGKKRGAVSEVLIS